MAHADRTYGCVRCFAPRVVIAGAEHLRLRVHLRVDLEADDRFQFHDRIVLQNRIPAVICNEDAVQVVSLVLNDPCIESRELQFTFLTFFRLKNNNDVCWSRDVEPEIRKA